MTFSTTPRISSTLLLLLIQVLAALPWVALLFAQARTP